jgi:hypothetical protein
MRGVLRLVFVLSFVAAGCSDGSTKPEPDMHGSGGAKSAGDASTSTGTGGHAANHGSGGSAVAVGDMDASTVGHDDAGPVASMDMDAGTDSALPPVDLTGLIPTSGSQLVFSSQPRADLGDYPPSQLYALDLKDGKTHDLGKAGLSYTTVSQDESLLLVGGANAASDTNLSIVRLTDQGVVPPTPISGFAGRPGNEYPKAWSGDGRYAFFERGSNIIGDGVDVVDTRTNSLLWYADTGLDDDNASVEVAPKGTWFAYWLGLDKRKASVAHIGSATVTSTALPIVGANFVFDSDGTHMAYPDTMGQITKLFVQTLGGKTDPAGDVDGYVFASPEAFMPDGRVLALLQPDPSNEQLVVEALSTNGADPVVIGDRTRTPNWRVPSRNFSSMVFLYKMQDSQDLAFVDPAGKAADVPIASYPTDAQVVIRAIDDERFFYTINADLSTATNAEVHVVQRADDGSALDTQLNTKDEVAIGCVDPFRNGPPASKLVFMDLKTNTLVLIDLSGDTPQRVATLPPSLDGAQRVYCPTWGPNGDAFAYTEISDTSSRIRLVRWGDAAPEDPQTAYEADAAVDILVVRP